MLSRRAGSIPARKGLRSTAGKVLRHKLPEPKLLRDTRTGEYIDPKELQKKQKNK